MAGGKNTSPGEMISNLGEKGVNVPSGFAITVEVYKHNRGSRHMLGDHRWLSRFGYMGHGKLVEEG